MQRRRIRNSREGCSQSRRAKNNTGRRQSPTGDGASDARFRNGNTMAFETNRSSEQREDAGASMMRGSTMRSTARPDESHDLPLAGSSVRTRGNRLPGAMASNRRSPL